MVAEALDGLSSSVPWLDTAGCQLRVERVGPRGDGYSVNLDLEADKQRPLKLIIEIRGDDVVAAAEVTNRRLRGERRMQLGHDEVGAVPVPELSMIVRRAGLDERILGLALLAHPERALRFTPDTGPLVSQLLSHRLGKRATLRIGGHGHPSLIVKAYKARSDIPEQVVQLCRALREAGIDTPAITHYDDAVNLIVMEDIAPDGPPATASTSEIAQALRSLHAQTDMSAPPHTPEAEIRILESAVTVLNVVQPTSSEVSQLALEHVSRKLRAIPCDDTTLIHRDAHSDQFILSNGRAWTLDLDTVSYSDPMIDVANIAAWHDLTGTPDEGESLAEIYGVTEAQRERFNVWREAAGLRLSCQAIPTGSHHQLAEAILERLAS